MLEQERINYINKQLEVLTKGFTLGKLQMLHIVDELFNNLVALNPQWNADEKGHIFKEVFRPMQETVLMHYYGRGE